MSTQAVLQEIKKHLAKGQTIASIRKQLVKEANQADNYGSAQIKFPSFSLMYTTNTNFQGGVQNKIRGRFIRCIKFGLNKKDC